MIRLLYALRSILPAPEDEKYQRDRPRDNYDPWERREEDSDLLAPLDEQLLQDLAVVDPREETDPKIHVVICGLRYKFVGSALRAIYDAVRAHGKGSRFNSGQLLIVRSQIEQMRGIMRLMVVAVFALAIIELFGRDKGLELLQKFAERWLGI